MAAQRLVMDALAALAGMELRESMIRFCKRFNQHSPLWNLERHSHAYLEMIFFLRGEAKIEAGSCSGILAPASYDTVVYFPNREHHETVDLTKSQEIICIWLDTGELPQYQDGVFRLRDAGRALEWLFVRLEAEYRARDRFSARLVDCYLNAIFQNMIRQLAQAEADGMQNAVQKARVYIQGHFTQTISMPTLADYCHVSASYLHRVFQRRLGMTPVQYITSLRILEAERLLGSSALSIVEIAARCGFDDSQYFSRVFKKQTKRTPSQYRESERRGHGVGAGAQAGSVADDGVGAGAPASPVPDARPEATE